MGESRSSPADDQFLLARVVRAIVTLWAVLTLVFVLIHATGDPIAVLAPEQMNAAQRAALAAALGLNQPLLVQYGHFIAGVLHGNLGVSYYSDTPAMPLLLSRVPVTLELVGLAIGIAVAIGMPFGIFAALRPDSVADRALRGLSVLGASVPTFFLGIVLIFIFSVLTNLLPASGAGSMRALHHAGLHPGLLPHRLLHPPGAQFACWNRCRSNTCAPPAPRA